MKKSLLFVLSLLMVLSLLAACGSAPTAAASSTVSAAAPTSSSSPPPPPAVPEKTPVVNVIKSALPTVSAPAPQPSTTASSPAAFDPRVHTTVEMTTVIAIVGNDNAAFQKGMFESVKKTNKALKAFNQKYAPVKMDSKDVYTKYFRELGKILDYNN